MYDRSVKDPKDSGAARKRIDWIKPYSKVKDTSPAAGPRPLVPDGTLNASANCTTGT